MGGAGRATYDASDGLGCDAVMRLLPGIGGYDESMPKPAGSGGSGGGWFPDMSVVGQQRTARTIRSFKAVHMHVDA